MFRSIGTLKYGPGIRLALLADEGIVDYYRSLASRYVYLNPQKYDAHVSVVRREQPDMTHWGKYEGEQIAFEYCHEIAHDETYYWLDVQCDRLKQVREELGLPSYPWWRNKYHLTIGNVKPSRDELLSAMGGYFQFT